MIPTQAMADPVEAITHGAPRMIHSDAELEQYTQALFTLTAKESPNAMEVEAINLLSLLVQTYEAERFSLAEASPTDVLRMLMQSHGLKQMDLIPQLGTVSNVSQILNGKRNLTLTHMRALSKRFKVPIGSFLG